MIVYQSNLPKSTGKYYKLLDYILAKIRKTPTVLPTPQAFKLSVSGVDTIPTKHLYCITSGHACQSVS